MNILSFFGRIGCEALPSPHSLFKEITDIEFNSSEDLFVQVQIFYVNYYNFDLKKVETFERENRNLDIREGRKHTTEYELKGQRRECGNNDSPSRDYN